MKRVKEIPFFKNIIQVREYQFGKFFFFDGIVISEINEGETFAWPMAKLVIADAHELLGKRTPIYYISNRVNAYKIVAKDWKNFFIHREQLAIYCIVEKTHTHFFGSIMERIFLRRGIRKFTDLEEAIAWVQQKKNKY